MLAPALVISLFAGIALGQRHRVFVLPPVCALALVLAAVMAVTHPDAIWRISAITMVSIFAVQVGYLAGISLRHFALVVRAKRLRSLSLGSSAPSRRPAH